MRNRNRETSLWIRIAIALAVFPLLFTSVGSAQTATVSVCGTVSSYLAPSAVLPGLIVIGGQTIPIAIGTNIQGEGLIKVGADLCLNGSLDVAGQLTDPVSVTATATTSLEVCGVVSAYTAATASAPGSITIGGNTIPIAAGTAIDGAGLITAGANLCLHGTVNGFGQLTVPSSMTANVTTSIQVCGVVTAYTAATASSAGSITIGGQTIPIAAGTAIDGAGLITLGANLCLSGTLNASGELVVPSSVSVGATTSISVCGVVTAYTAATASSAGSLTIGGQTIPIAAGTNINGSGLIQVGANLCLNGTLNASGQLVPPASVAVDGSLSVSLCGVVSAYTSATASAPGSITIGGQMIPIAAGTSLAGSGFISIGANLCLNGTLNASGQLVPPSSVAVNVSSSVNVCGVVTAFAPATASAPGSITIGGQSFSIAPGATLGFSAQVGQVLCADFTVTPGPGSGGSGGGSQIVGGESVPVGREIIIPVAARVQGQGGAFWTTDLRIVNLGGSSASVTIEWYPFSPSGRPGPAQVVSVTVAPGVQGIFDGALETLFQTDGGGSLRLVSTSPSIGAALRLFHEQRADACGGAFGLWEKGLLASESVSRGALLVLENMPGDPSHQRTNLGYFNASAQTGSITFRVFTTDGQLLGTKTVAVPGFANDQKSIFALIDTVPASDRAQRDLYVTFEAQGGLPFVYGSSVYNSTNDALFVSPWQY
jgi:hypothetical protein